jgi:hypothetical protein
MADPDAPTAPWHAEQGASTEMSGRDYREDAALQPQPRRHGADAWQTPASLIDA